MVQHNRPSQSVIKCALAFGKNKEYSEHKRLCVLIAGPQVLLRKYKYSLPTRASFIFLFFSENTFRSWVVIDFCVLWTQFFAAQFYI